MTNAEQGAESTVPIDLSVLTSKTESTQNAIAEDSSLRKQIVQRLSRSAVVNILGQLLLLISSVALARALGKHGYGDYSFIMSVIALIGLPTKAGLPVLMVREVARLRMVEDWSSFRGLLEAASNFVAIYSATAATVVALVVWSSGGLMFEYYWATILLPAVAIAEIRSATLRGLKFVVLGQIPEMIVRPLVIIAGLVIWLGVDGTTSVLDGVKVTVLAAFTSLLAGVGFLRTTLPTEVRLAAPLYRWGDWARSIVPLSLLSGLRIFDAQLSLVVIGIVAEKADVGIYRVALSGAALVSLGLGIANGVLAPFYATLLEANDVRRIERIACRTSDALVFISLVPALVLWFGGNLILSVTFGPEFREAWLPMGLLVIGHLINVAAGSVGLLLSMGRYEVDALKSVAIATVLKFVAMIALVPWFGLTGAAIGEVVSMVTWNVLMAVAVKRRIGIRAFGSLIRI